MPRPFPTLAAAALAAALAGSAAAQELEPAAALARAVDLGTAAERRAAADELSRRKDVPLERWLELAASCGRLEPAEPGAHREEVELQVGKARERAELFVYVPPGYRPGAPAPLLLQAHGTGGSGRNGHRMWQEVADRLGMLVLSPSEAGENEGYAFSERERLAALAALRWARRRFDVDESRVLASGISRGGHLVWDLALRHPDRFAAIAPMIGGPRLNIAAGQNNLRFAENVVRLPIRDLQGARDDPLLLFNLRLLFEKLRALGARDAELIEFEQLGHAFDPGAVDWAAFFGGARRDPKPREVVLRCGAGGERRAFWVEVLQTDRSVVDEFRLKVREKEWSALDDQGKRRHMQDEADARTARLRVAMREPGVFGAEGKGVVRFRLLLTADMLGPKHRVEVTFAGKTRRVTARPSSRVLLRELVERFDRTFLPVAEVTVP